MKRSGFTLSEVLLVLSVIGVVAAITIPTLVQKVSNDQVVSSIKKNFAVLSQATIAILTENGGTMEGNLFIDNGTVGARSTNLVNAYSRKLNFIKVCGNALGCLYTTQRFLLSGATANNNFDADSVAAGDGTGILSDGTLLRITDYAGDCTYSYGVTPLTAICGNITVDVNGNKLPNTAGRDIFEFFITKDALYPRGTTGDPGNCITTGYACTAKVLVEGAINY